MRDPDHPSSVMVFMLKIMCMLIQISNVKNNYESQVTYLFSSCEMRILPWHKINMELLPLILVSSLIPHYPTKRTVEMVITLSGHIQSI